MGLEGLGQLKRVVASFGLETSQYSTVPQATTRPSSHPRIFVNILTTQHNVRKLDKCLPLCLSIQSFY
jgi:hypothetical protein